MDPGFDGEGLSGGYKLTFLKFNFLAVKYRPHGFMGGQGEAAKPNDQPFRILEPGVVRNGPVKLDPAFRHWTPWKVPAAPLGVAKHAYSNGGLGGGWKYKVGTLEGNHVSLP